MRGGDKGYLLPENVQPEGLLCLTVYIPDDPTGYYLAAFSGAFSDFGRWNQWERDGTNRGSLAAQTWKDAIDYTYENGWLNCMNCCDEILDRLTNLENLLGEFANMNINVNCGCGCGCNGQNQGQEFLDLSNEEGFQPFPDEPYIGLGEEMQNLCDAATQWADGVLETMTRMKTFFAGVAVTVTSVSSFISGILKVQAFKLILSPALFFQLVVSAIAIALTANVTDEAKDAAEERKNDFICAIIGATTPQDAKSRVLGIVSQIRADYGVLTASLFYALVQITDWRKVTIENDGLIMPEYVGSDCSFCQNAPMDIFGDGSWYLVPASIGELVTENNATMTEALGIWEFSGSGGFPEAAYFPNLETYLAPGRTWFDASQVAETSEHGGYVMLRLSSTGDIYTYNTPGAGMFGLDPADFIADDVWGARQNDSELSSVDFHAGVAALFPGLSYAAQPDVGYTSLGNHQVVFTLDNLQTGTASVRIYAVVKGTALNV